VAGHGSRLGAKQEQAIAALLTEPSGGLEGAAQKAGVPLRTLKRWLTLPDFLAAYREARRQVVELAVTALQQTCARAVGTLTRNLECGNPAAENTAAKLILENALRAIELLDMQTDIENLKRQLSEAQRGPGHFPAGPAEEPGGGRWEVGGVPDPPPPEAEGAPGQDHERGGDGPFAERFTPLF
jgi:hypothetical protein